MEYYLKSITEKQIRSEICKLRISAHDLMVERLRYVPEKPEADKRFCKFCPTLPDTEFHFMMECSNNQTCRQELLIKVHDIYPQFSLLQDNEKFVKLMQCSDSEIALLVGRFIVEIIRGRKDPSWI